MTPAAFAASSFLLLVLMVVVSTLIARREVLAYWAELNEELDAETDRLLGALAEMGFFTEGDDYEDDDDESDILFLPDDDLLAVLDDDAYEWPGFDIAADDPPPSYDARTTVRDLFKDRADGAE